MCYCFSDYNGPRYNLGLVPVHCFSLTFSISFLRTSMSVTDSLLMMDLYCFSSYYNHAMIYVSILFLRALLIVTDSLLIIDPL